MSDDPLIVLLARTTIDLDRTMIYLQEDAAISTNELIFALRNFERMRVNEAIMSLWTRMNFYANPDGPIPIRNRAVKMMCI